MIKYTGLLAWGTMSFSALFSSTGPNFISYRNCILLLDSPNLYSYLLNSILVLLGQSLASSPSFFYPLNKTVIGIFRFTIRIHLHQLSQLPSPRALRIKYCWGCSLVTESLFCFICNIFILPPPRVPSVLHAEDPCPAPCTDILNQGMFSS